MRKLQDFDYKNKRVFLRVDLNVPVANGIILDETRIDKIIPTIKYLQKMQAKIIIASHFGRPKAAFEPKFSLEFLVKKLEEKLDCEVLFAANLSDVNLVAPITLLENLRFYPGETTNDFEFAQQLAKLADFYINDAFSCSHREHASITKIAELLPSAAGLLLQQEIKNLEKYLLQAEKPMMAIIGGSKVSTKLALLKQLAEQVDYLVIGGAMANTFFKSLGYEVGASFYEPELLDQAKEILTQDCKIILPQDVIVTDRIADDSIIEIVDSKLVPQDRMIVDIGPATIIQIQELLISCKTVILNGPVGIFEYASFAQGTIAITKTVAELTQKHGLISVAGGGDIVAAISQANLFDQFTYISTAGGAFLEWLEGKKLPGLAILN